MVPPQTPPPQRRAGQLSPGLPLGVVLLIFTWKPHNAWSSLFSLVIAPFQPAPSASRLTALWSLLWDFLSQIFLLLTSFLVACRPCMGITIFIPCLRVLGWVSCGCEFAPTQLSLVRRLLEDPLPAPQDLLQMWHFPFPCLSHPVMRCSVTSLLSFCWGVLWDWEVQGWHHRILDQMADKSGGSHIAYK